MLVLRSRLVYHNRFRRDRKLEKLWFVHDECYGAMRSPRTFSYGVTFPKITENIKKVDDRLGEIQQGAIVSNYMEQE